MMLPIFSGQKYSYCYEVETGHYLLFDNEHQSHAYLQGDDARLFREQMEHIDSLNVKENKTELLTENTISLYL